MQIISQYAYGVQVTKNVDFLLFLLLINFSSNKHPFPQMWEWAVGYSLKSGSDCVSEPQAHLTGYDGWVICRGGGGAEGGVGVRLVIS